MTAIVPLGSLPSALKVVEAVKLVNRLKPIGYCPSKVADMRAHMEYYGAGDGSLSKEGLEVSPRVSREEREREEHNAATVSKFAALHPEYGQNSASGYLDKPFSLRITRPGCEFDGSISPPSKFYHYRNEPQFSEADIEQKKTRLQAWYDNAKVSGYGDVQDQVTKIDASVRDAREIPASEFIVKRELLDEIANLWDTHFYSNQGVRVQPYKIHLYGPGGHFSVHRDTPQTDLVGTFLLGLGDSSTCGGLYVDGEEMPAHEAHWCAFYPDVPHCVTKVSGGHRAVIAFKIFRDTSGTSKDSSKVEEQVAELVRSMKAPFGIMLERKYCLGTSVLSGFDNLLLTAMHSLDTLDVKHLPVVVTSNSRWGMEHDYENSCSTDVYPFTPGHIDALVQRSELGSYEVPLDHTSCGFPWLQGVKHVPFFAFAFERSVFTYSENEDETINHVGNEAEAWRADSVYLSYALLALPKHYQAPSDAGSAGGAASDNAEDSEKDTDDSGHDDDSEDDEQSD
ncbi:hypothetical protein C8Q74DRAFT_1197219 [Fomes fomentarius]|nr:hypothetical protein C8Q74DRAFT_1197219 [Fomes fomentarius]